MSNITINIGRDAEPKPRKRARVAVPQDPNRRPIRVVKPPQPQVSPAVMAMPQAQAQAMPQRIMQAQQRQGVILRQPNQIIKPQAVVPRPVSRGTSTSKKVMNVAKYATPWGAAKGGIQVAKKLTNNKVMNVAKYATPWGAAKGGLKVAGKVGKKLGKKLKKFKKRW